MSYGSGLQEVFQWGCGIIVILFLAVLFFGGLSFFRSGDIESKTIIIPTIKLTIENNKVDTLYIYKRDK